MGEIADALRRARGQDSPAPLRRKPKDHPGEDDELALPRLRGILPPAEAPAPEVPAGDPERDAPGQWIDALDPDGSAVVPEGGPQAEVCRHVAMRLRDAMDARNAHSVAVVSAERGDGKSTVACNLAVSLASLSGERDVALIDLDLRKPSLAYYLDLQPTVGIEQVLLGSAELEDVAISVRQPEIDLYPAVVPQRAAHELMVLPRLAEVLGDLERRYATVIIDTPPTPVVPDANLLLRHVKCCAVVVRRGKTRARSVRRLVDGLRSQQILGWVLNCDRTSLVNDRDYYYYGEREVKGS